MSVRKMVNSIEKELRNSPITVLTEGCFFKGKLLCSGTSHVGGKVEGEIFSHGLLIIEQGADIKADINGEIIKVYGRVTGNINVKEKVELYNSSIVQGKIITPNLIVEEGAIIDGATSMFKPRGYKAEESTKVEAVSDFDSLKDPLKEEDEFNQIRITT